MRKILLLIFILTIFTPFAMTQYKELLTRKQVDTIGFASNAKKMEVVMERIQVNFGELINDLRKANKVTDDAKWKTAICPHDDYTYANYLYPLVLKNIKAKTIILFGVAHKAKMFGLENKLVFDSFDQWQSAYGPVKISSLRDELIKNLNTNSYVVHDSMQAVEHSVEAIVPFLQYYNPKVEIVPVLVPYMPYQKIEELADDFAKALNKVTKDRKLKWGEDFAIVISNDAVHYGDEEWGGSNYAFMGADSAGYQKAMTHEKEIISNCLTGKINPERIKQFTQYTVQADDYRQYKWTWCGRYSVPLGLMVSYDLSKLQKTSIKGHLLGYSTSISEKNPDFTDIGMGATAVANIHHWVGFTAIGYR